MKERFNTVTKKVWNGWLKFGVKFVEEQRKQKPGDMILIIFAVNILIPLAAAAIGHADSLAPLLGKVQSEWTGSGVLLAGLIGTVIGVLALLLGRGWMALVYGLVGAFIGGAAADLTSCAVTTGDSIDFTAS
jgi:hypothetical protein